MWLLLLSAWALGPPPEATPIARHVDALAADADLVTLDVSETAVAIKIVSRADWFTKCSYVGMDATPQVDVRLALFDLVTNKSTVWVIYEGTQPPGSCTPFADSEKRLEEAKAAFAAAGLNIDNKPEPDARGEAFTLQHSSKSTPFQATWRQIEGDIRDGAFNPQGAGVTLEYEIRMDGDVVHRSYEWKMGAMGVRISGRPPWAYLRGDHAVLMVNKAHTQLGEPGETGAWSFTRVRLPTTP